MAGNREYQRRRLQADMSFPFRITFDAPLSNLAAMMAAADQAYGARHIMDDRMHFYFASKSRLDAFVLAYGPGRQLSNSEAQTLMTSGRPAPDHWISIALPDTKKGPPQ